MLFRNLINCDTGLPFRDAVSGWFESRIEGSRHEVHFIINLF